MGRQHDEDGSKTVRRIVVVAVSFATCMAAAAWAAPGGQTSEGSRREEGCQCEESRYPRHNHAYEEASAGCRDTAAAEGGRGEEAGRPRSPPPAGRTPMVENPRVTCDRWPSNYDAKSWIEDVWRLENAQSGEQKTLALYKWVRLHAALGRAVLRRHARQGRRASATRSRRSTSTRTASARTSA